MELLSKQNSWKVWQGVVLQIVCVLLLATAGGAMQFYWGMTGLVTTELMYLAIAILIAVVHKTSLKEVFPIKKISLVEFIGLCIFFAGGFLINIVAGGISFMIFPDAQQEAQGLNDFMAGTSPFLLVLIVAVLPAICEEAIERGAVLSHLRSIKKDWVIVLLMGLFFGIFHLSFVRFLNTACLGAILTYMVVKKNNILYSVLFHFFNNFISVLATIVSAGAESELDVSSIDISRIAPIYLVIGCAGPVLLVLGNMLMCPKAFRKRQWIYAGSISFILLCLGSGLFMRSIYNEDSIVVKSKFNYEVDRSNLEQRYSFEIDDDGVYIVSVASMLDHGTATLVIKDEDGEVIASDGSKRLALISDTYELHEGTYILEIDSENDAIGATADIDVRIYSLE